MSTPLVLPDLGPNMMKPGEVANSATLLLQRGDSLWNGTKIEVSLADILTVRTWEKDEGRINKWQFDGRNSKGL